MEVHRHSHANHGSKKFKEYFLEFLMLFLAVTLGFFAENLRENFTDHKKEKGYVQSLVADLKEDTTMIVTLARVNLKMTRGQDSLVILLNNYKDTGTVVRKSYRYYFLYTTNFAEMVFNERTISQLLNAGGMRLIEDQKISDSIMDYNSRVKNVKAQGDAYNEYFKKTLDLSTAIFDYSYARVDLDERYHIKPIIPKEKIEFKLLTADPAILKKYANQLSLSRSILQGYIINLIAAKTRATSLIILLKKKYRLN
jgi:hypothetical protein